MLKIAEINAAMRQITDLVNATCGKRPIITALSCHFNPNLTNGGLDLQGAAGKSGLFLNVSHSMKNKDIDEIFFIQLIQQLTV